MSALKNGGLGDGLVREGRGFSHGVGRAGCGIWGGEEMGWDGMGYK